MGPHGQGVYLDFADAIHRLGLQTVREKYGNLFEIYEKITGEDAYKVPMRIYPAPHYTMGGLWVDYHLMSTIPGLFVGGEANFSDHGANRLGASALMQGLADGYFVLPATVPDYVAAAKLDPVSSSDSAFRETTAEVKDRIDKLLAINGKRTPDSSTESSERLFGMIAAWPVLMQDCARRSTEFRNYVTSSGTTFVSSARAKS